MVKLVGVISHHSRQELIWQST